MATRKPGAAKGSKANPARETRSAVKSVKKGIGSMAGKGGYSKATQTRRGK